MATKNTTKKTDDAPEERESETRKKNQNDDHPKGQVNGDFVSPEDARQSQIEALDAQHQREREELEKRHERERADLSPEQKAVAQDAYDATRPRGPEAPHELLKPSQRQGEGIEAGLPPDTQEAGVAL